MKWKTSHMMYYTIWLVGAVIILYILTIPYKSNEGFVEMKLGDVSVVTSSSSLPLYNMGGTLPPGTIPVSSFLTQTISDQASASSFYFIDPADWDSSSIFTRNRPDSKLIFSDLAGRVTSYYSGDSALGVTYPTPKFDALCSAVSGVKNEGGQRWYPPTGYDVYVSCNTNIVADISMKTPESTLDSATCSVSEFKNTINKDPLKTYVRDVAVDTTRNMCKTSYQPYKFRTAGEIQWTGSKYEPLTYYGLGQFNSTSDYAFYSVGGRSETSIGNPDVPWLPYLKYAFTLKKACEEVGGGFLMETLEQPVCYFSLGAAKNIVNRPYTDSTAGIQTQQVVATAPATTTTTTAATTAAALTSGTVAAAIVPVSTTAPVSSITTKSTDSSSQSSEKSGSKLPLIIGGTIGGAVGLVAIVAIIMKQRAAAAAAAASQAYYSSQYSYNRRY